METGSHSLLKKIDYVLGPQARIDSFVLFGLMAIGAGFEALGIGMILPLVGLIAKPDVIESYPLIKEWAELVGLTTTNELIIAAAGALLFVFVIKNSYLAWMYNRQFRFIYRNMALATERLLRAYVFAPYVYHVDRNSSDLVRNLTIEMSNVFNRLLMPAFTLAVEFLVLIVVGVLLFVLDPLAAITALAVLGGVGSVFYFIVRRRMLAYGERQQKHASLMIKWINQGIGGIKEAKVRQVENYFLSRFQGSTDAFADSFRASRFLQLMPRFFIETIAVGGIGIVLTALLISGREMVDIVAVLGVFGLAAVRLMPSLTRIISALTAVKNTIPGLDVVFSDLWELESNQRSTLTNSPSMNSLRNRLSVQDVVYRYPNADSPTLDGLSLSVERGQSVAFVGSSGSGKTTTVDVILGLLPAESGSVLLDGEPIQNELGGWLGLVGYIAQPVYLLDDTVRGNVLFGLGDDEVSDQRVWTALEAARLAEHIRTLPQGLDTVVGENGARLSGGQRQRIGIARALFRNPEVLILDEATSALDNKTEGEIVQTISELRGEKTLITVAHRLSTVRNCDKIFFMADGRVEAEGTFDELLSTNARFRELTSLEQPDVTTAPADSN